MSIITLQELEYTDVEWYGIDICGNIAVFCSAGIAKVPDFVCSNKENYETLIDFFNKLPNHSEVEYLIPPCDVAERFSRKGLYYYDADDNTTSSLMEYYTLQSKPISPIKIFNLPLKIQNLLKNNLLTVQDFNKQSRIEIENGYNC